MATEVYRPRQHLVHDEPGSSRFVWDEPVFHIVQQLSDGTIRVHTGSQPQPVVDHVLGRIIAFYPAATIGTDPCPQDGCENCAAYMPVAIPDDNPLGAMLTSILGDFWLNQRNAVKREAGVQHAEVGDPSELYRDRV